MKVSQLRRQIAETEGFAVFNDCAHLCVELSNDTQTISVRTPDGELVTFAFIGRPDSDGHQCVDILHHTAEKKDSGGRPLQTVTLWHGGTGHVSSTIDDIEPTTLVSLNLRKAN